MPRCINIVIDKTTKKSRKCKRIVKDTGTYCKQHTDKIKYTLQRSDSCLSTVSDKSIASTVSCNYDDFEIGKCCFCNNDCNPCSQTCGRCARNLTFYCR